MAKVGIDIQYNQESGASTEYIFLIKMKRQLINQKSPLLTSPGALVTAESPIIKKVPRNVWLPAPETSDLLISLN